MSMGVDGTPGFEHPVQMRHFLLLPLPFAVACGACADGESATVEDPEGLVAEVTVATIASDLEILLAAIGEGRVCVDRVEFGHVDDDTSDLRGGGDVVRIDPDAEDPRWELRVELCVALDAREHLSEDPLFPDQVTFLGECALGPFDAGWAPELEAACGEPLLTEAQWFMAERVYPSFRGLDADGDLVTALGEPVLVAGIESRALRELAPLADGAIALAFPEVEADAPGELELAMVDLVTGQATRLLALTGDDLQADVYGGPEAAALHVEVDGVPELHVVEAGTLAMTTLPTTARPYGWTDASGAVSGGLFFLTRNYPATDPILTIDLETGVEGELALPPPADPALQTVVSEIVAAPGGIVATFYEAIVERGGDSVRTVVYAGFIARWDAASGWTELMRADGYEGALHAAGSTDGGRLVGTSWSTPGIALAAYDVEADTLLVSSDLCPDDLVDPALVVGETLYDVRRGDTLVLQPIVVSAE